MDWTIKSHELWNGVKLNLSGLKIFGSTVIVHIPKEKKQKFDKKARQQIFVGYSDIIKGYRIYNSVTNDVNTSRDTVSVDNQQSSEKQPKKSPVANLCDSESFSSETSELFSSPNLNDSDYIPHTNRTVLRHYIC